MRARAAAVVLVGLALAAATALKLSYSAASADELRWILAPTALLVELITGADFAYETGAGYLSTELRFVIAPSCAGVNFLIVAFAALVLGFVRPARGPARNALVVAASAAAAYAAALVANALRVSLAIWLHTDAVAWGWLTDERLHRISGVAIYLAVLLAVFAAARRLAGASVGLRIPIATYVAVALLIPLLRGGYARADYWAHAATVLPLAAAAALLCAAIAAAARWSARRRADRTAPG
jgi:exosortase K